MDIFRQPKPAAGLYKSQCDPEEEAVLGPAFSWARGDESVGFGKAMFSSNCDHLKIYVDGKLVADADPDRDQFPHLGYAPFTVDLSKAVSAWGDLRVEGDLQGRQVIVKSFSGTGGDQAFEVLADDATLFADGADATRVVFRVTDEFGAIRPFANDAIRLDLEGPAQLIGDNPFEVVGGTGAVWIRATEQPGTVRLTARHPVFGKKQVQIAVVRLLPKRPRT